MARATVSGDMRWTLVLRMALPQAFCPSGRRAGYAPRTGGLMSGTMKRDRSCRVTADTRIPVTVCPYACRCSRALLPRRRVRAACAWPCSPAPANSHTGIQSVGCSAGYCLPAISSRGPRGSCVGICSYLGGLELLLEYSDHLHNTHSTCHQPPTTMIARHVYTSCLHPAIRPLTSSCCRRMTARSSSSCCCSSCCWLRWRSSSCHSSSQAVQ